MSKRISGAGQRTELVSPYQIQVSYGASPSILNTGIARGTGADWFGPLNPLSPIAPPDIAGRRFDFPAGDNLNTRPRAYEPIGFHELRGFADAYDLLRLVIETRKDQMERQRWRIRPRHSQPSPARGGGLGRGRSGASLDAETRARIAALEHFFQKPDGVTRWKTWLRALLEDMFVIDAATLFCQRTRSGQLFALHQLDGATIKRVIDDWGRTPQPFCDADGVTVFPPAYQQVLKGMPAVNYSARDIIYRPRNVRAHKVYGYSPVQQVLMTVNIALRRQLWQLDYFTEGSIPDALIGVPQGWTPEQIKQFQDYWDTEFAGDLAKRRRAKFVPGDTAAKVVQTKEPQHKDDFDEWLARIICFAFSVPPQWAVRLMNRATADNQSAQSEEEGLEPTKEWVKDLVDEIISEEFSSPDLELHWLDEDADAAGLEASLEGRVKLGAVTLNEMRDHLGLDPYANAAADRPMVLTATGYVPIEANVEGGGTPVGTNTNAEPAAQKQSLFKVYNPQEPRVPKHHTSGGEWTYDGAVASYNDPQILTDAPDPTSTPWAQSGQRRPRGGGYNEGTPAQEARLEVARARWQYIIPFIRQVDPTWQPRASAIAYPPTPEGEIAKYEAEAQEAQDRLAEITDIGGAVAPPRGGHHWVPKAVFEDQPLQPDTMKVFEDSRSGPLADMSVNWWTSEHVGYNDAVEQAFKSFLDRNMISAQEMTPDQARAFVDEVLRSNDPRIRDFNRRIIEERLRYLYGDKFGGEEDSDDDD
jgi:hypothetical protein